MNSFKFTISVVLLISFFGILTGGSWQDDWERGNLYEWDPTPEHTMSGFVRGYIGNPDPPMKLMYAFYIITDPHIGDYDVQYSEEDYNKPGYYKSLDTVWVDATGDHNLGDGPGGRPHGGVLGNHMQRAVQLINHHYNYGEGSGRFCVILGDISASAERAELHHGKIKLDSLDCPWLPLMGNHDTWPWIRYGENKTTQYDLYFDKVFGGYLKSYAPKAFPCWDRASIPNTPASDPHWQNWGFTWGPYRHLGLDFNKRSKGGIKARAKLYKNDDGGTFGFFKSQLAEWDDDTKKLLMFVHHPLSFQKKDWLWDQFSESEMTDILTEVREHYPDRLNYWFSGHAHRGGDIADSSVVWEVGLDGLSAPIAKVHFFPGVYGYEKEADNTWTGKRYQVGLIEVYGHKKCDFSYLSSSLNPPFVNLGVPITFVDECESSDGVPPTSYYWTFGDGGWSTSSGPNHTYQNVVDKYYVQLKATFTSGETFETYTSKPLFIGFQYPQWDRIRFTPYSNASNLGSPLSLSSSAYYAELTWWSKGYIGWEYDKYEAYRQIWPYGTTIKIPKPPRVGVKPQTLRASVKDDGPFSSGQQVRFQILAKWQDHHYTELGESPKPIEDFWGRDTVVQVPGDPDPPPSCPEIYSLIGYDSGTEEFEFAPNNTVLAHSSTNPIMATDMLVLDHPLYEHEGFTAVTMIERNTETSVFDQLKLHFIDHPEGTGITTGADGQAYCHEGYKEPWACYDAFENDYLSNVLPHTGSENSLKAVAGQEIFIEFDDPCWGEGSGLLISTGIPAPEGAHTAPYKNNQICAHQEDTSGGWREIGIAYCRSDPSDWMIEADTGGAMLPSFKLQFAGDDTACINHIFLTALLPDSEWVDTAVSPVTGTHWQLTEQPGQWNSSDQTFNLQFADGNVCDLGQTEQLAVVFPAVASNPDTTMERDYVLECYGVYTSVFLPSTDIEETKPVFTYALAVRQTRPFSRVATIFYQVPRSTHVSLALYDATGRLVKSFVEEEVTRGSYSVPWDGTDSKGAKVSSGAYFIKIKAQNFDKTHKLVILD